MCFFPYILVGFFMFVLMRFFFFLRCSTGGPEVFSNFIGQWTWWQLQSPKSQTTESSAARFRWLNYKKACDFQKPSMTCKRVFYHAWIQNSRRQRQATLLGAHSTHKRSMFLRIFYFPARLLQNPTHKPSASSSRSLQPTTHIGEEYIDYTTWTPILQITHNQKPTVCYAYWEGKPEISPLRKCFSFFCQSLWHCIPATGCYFWHEQGSSALQMHPWSLGQNPQQTAKWAGSLEKKKNLQI